jgi:hypothetical protein
MFLLCALATVAITSSAERPNTTSDTEALRKDGAIEMTPVQIDAGNQWVKNFRTLVCKLHSKVTPPLLVDLQRYPSVADMNSTACRK